MSLSSTTGAVERCEGTCADIFSEVQVQMAITIPVTRTSVTKVRLIVERGSAGPIDTTCLLVSRADQRADISRTISTSHREILSKKVQSVSRVTTITNASVPDPATPPRLPVQRAVLHRVGTVGGL